MKTEIDGELHWSIQVVDTKDIELQTLSALASVMDRFEELRSDPDEIIRQETRHRIARWFHARYGTF